MELAGANAIAGPRVFDVQIAATMMAFDVGTIATYNGADFKEFTDITVIEPA